MSSAAERVKALREQAGSHDKLAALVGTSRQTIIRWEKGARPQPHYRKRLAELSGEPEEAFIPNGLTPQIESDFVAAVNDLAEQVRDLRERLDALERRRDPPG